MLQNRPPIVVILGHVDHGKTSLLDALLKTSVAAKEAGGITQSVRAFQLHSPQTITFIDTPGHQAFFQMRSRGDQVADIALLIVSGIDGVMPQTKESIATIKSTGHPYIVVVTKADLPDFDLDKIKAQLAENQVMVEGYGGDVPLVAVSAKTGKGLADLLELIALVAELHPVQADPDTSLEAVVLESSRHASKGPLATVIIKNGTLASGQDLYIGDKLVGKVRAISLTTTGKKVTSAGPATPVEILGLSDLAAVGAIITAEAGKSVAATVSFTPPVKSEGFKIILKADVAGSLEAVQAMLPADMTTVSSGTGDVTESDVLLAQSTGAAVVGFNVKVPASVAKLAEIDKVKIYTANIIYDLLEKIELLAHPVSTEVIVGKAQILAEFKIDASKVAGCKCLEGEISKANQIKVGEKQVRIKSLRIGKMEVEQVKAGIEFGAIFSPAVDFKIGDIIIAIESHG